MASRLVAANLYVSEGLNTSLVASLMELANASKDTVCIRTHCDTCYNRTGFTLVGQPEGLSKAVLRLSETALQNIDMRHHTGTHPRLGAVDHVSLHPIGGSSMDAAAAAGDAVGGGLGSLGMSVLCYGSVKKGESLLLSPAAGLSWSYLSASPCVRRSCELLPRYEQISPT
ncbi:unnamed protein product [Chrysoparadoxa australica]